MSDDEANINSLAHQRLLQAVTNLRKSQHIGKPTRNEPHVEPNEFGLVKKQAVEVSEKQAGASGAQVVKVNDIVKVLKTSDKHTKTKNLLTNVRKSKKVLVRPLEKPAEDRIKRKLGYENVKAKLKRWNAVVAKNRTSDTQVFPLPAAETVFVNTAAYAKPLERSVRSDLQQQLMETEQKLKRLCKERDNEPLVDEADLAKREAQLMEQQLTREELLAKRKELAYMKLKQSQLQAKTRMQNKVKSKKYHKLLKRQKMKEQMKEFELLQKTNPEAAMEKLDAMERNRIYERASLRHKNTGTWAKNLQMRAKYDQTVRKDLAEQLQISRELTQKKVEQEEGENEADEEQVVDNVSDAETDPFNPWTRAKSNNKENVADEEQDKNWRQYWLERNENEKLLQQYEQEKQVVKEKKNKKKMSKTAVYEKGWLVEELAEQTEQQQPAKPKDIDSIFDEGEERLQNRVQKKMQKLEARAERLKKQEKQQPKGKKQRKKNAQEKPNKELENLKKLELKNQMQTKVVLDEVLNADELKKPKSLLEKAACEEEPADKIDVTKLANVRVQTKRVQLVDLQQLDAGDEAADDNDDDDDDNEQQLHISEAFEDDDIVADFSAEKQDNTQLKNTELELSMPGWGSWAGAGISEEVLAARNAKAKKRRLILHLAQQKKRADNKKANVYIKESVGQDVRQHLVSDVPFPFKRVKDFEASVRAPVGRTFVPETAFRMLIRPEVRVRKGQVIQPMDEAELVKPAKRLRHEVDKRIAVVQQEKEKHKKINK